MNKYKLPSLDTLIFEDEEMYGYLIKSYIQYAKNEISNLSLHPVAPHTSLLMESCNSLIDTIADFEHKMPLELLKIDHEKRKLVYKKIYFDDNIDQMYIKLVAIKKEVFAIDVQLQNIYKEAHKLLTWNLIGLPMSTTNYGLLFTRHTLKNTVHTYDFSISNILGQNKVHYVHTNHIDTWEYSTTTNYTTKKHEYVKKINHLQTTPLCLSVTWEQPIPLENTVIPIIHQELPVVLEKMKL